MHTDIHMYPIGFIMSILTYLAFITSKKMNDAHASSENISWRGILLIAYFRT